MINGKLKKRLILSIIFITICLCIFAGASSCGGNSNDIGGTNIQEEGIDEGDIAKYVDGYLYVIQSDGITVSKTSENGKVELIFKYKQKNISPCELYISNGKLIVIYKFIKNDGVIDNIWYAVKIFQLKNISENSNINIESLYYFEFKGEYKESRIDTLKNKMLLCYTIKEKEQIVFDQEIIKNKKNKDDIYRDTVLEYDNNGKTGVISKKEKLNNVPKNIVSDDITVYASIDMIENKFNLDLKATYGFPFQTLYVSENGFYTVYSYNEIIRNGKGCGGIRKVITHTVIAKISTDNLSIVAQKFFNEMQVVTRHAIKDTGEYVYIAMQETNYNAVIMVSTDSNLNVVGYLSDICSDEQIKSVSYVKENEKLYCNLVTYKENINLDPLFKIDITSPQNMAVSGLLCVDGFSSYTINFEGGYTVGIGEDGNNGVKISLFDIKNDIPVEIKSFIKEEAYSEAIDNSRAFCVDKQNKIFAVPIIEIVNVNTLHQRLYFYKITDEGDFLELGFIENEVQFVYNDIEEMKNQVLYIRRAFYKEGYIYVISEANIISLKLNDVENGIFNPIYNISTVIE